MRRRRFDAGARAMARALLGDVLVVQTGATRCAGRIVETEAYPGPHDAASHSARGRTRANDSMFIGGGHLYVYLCHGVHRCMNVVTGRPGSGAAVLLRAIEPLEGRSLMRRRRRCADRDLCRGPGRLCAALGVGMEHDALDLRTDDRIWIEPGRGPSSIASGPRVGMGKAAGRVWAAAPLRFCDASSTLVSRPAGTKTTSR